MTIGTIIKTAGPLWAAVFLVALLANVAQVGFMLAPKRLKPDFKKINPISGFKKFASLRILVELFKNIGKLLVVGTVAYITVRNEVPMLPKADRHGDHRDTQLHHLGMLQDILPLHPGHAGPGHSGLGLSKI